MYEIEVRNVTKRFGSTVALDDVSLVLEENKIYGLLGRNGAGKTTLLNLMTGKLFSTRGEIELGGSAVQENDQVLNRIFYMTEPMLYPAGLKIREAFFWTGEFYSSFDQDYARKLATRFGLGLDKKVKTLSTGYSTIFKAILALASGADVLLFDEPVLGLDANHRELLYKEILANFIEKPKTVVISTHLIDEVADIVEEALILNEGKLILKQSVEDLLQMAYTVAGEISKVQQYVAGKRCIGAQTLQNFKSAIVFGSKRDESLAESLGLELGRVELQRLFVALTNGEGEVEQDGADR